MILRCPGATPSGGWRYTCGVQQVSQSSRKQGARVRPLARAGYPKPEGAGGPPRTGTPSEGVLCEREQFRGPGNCAWTRGSQSPTKPVGGASRRGEGQRRARKGAVSGNLGTRSNPEPLGRSGQRDSKQHQALSYLPAREKSSPWLQHPRATTLAQHRLPVPALG